MNKQGKPPINRGARKDIIPLLRPGDIGLLCFDYLYRLNLVLAYVLADFGATSLLPKMRG